MTFVEKLANLPVTCENWCEKIGKCFCFPFELVWNLCRKITCNMALLAAPTLFLSFIWVFVTVVFVLASGIYPDCKILVILRFTGRCDFLPLEFLIWCCMIGLPFVFCMNTIITIIMIYCLYRTEIIHGWSLMIMNIFAHKGITHLTNEERCLPHLEVVVAL